MNSPTEPHKFDCDKSHLHVAPGCCGTACWCVVDAVLEATKRVEAARATLPEVPTFYDVVRHTNPPSGRKAGKKRRKLVSGADLRSSIVNALFRCKRESDFALIETILREGLAEARASREMAQKIATQTGLPPYMDTNEVAALLGVNVPTIHHWRLSKRGTGGPPFERLTANRVRYRTEDVIAWTKTHVKVGSTWRSIEDVARSRVEEKPRREGLLTISQAADYLGVSTEALRKWRKENRGPQYVKLGPKLFAYKREELDAFRNWP